MARVVVVVVNWNAGTLLRDCLAALRRQTFADFAAVIVDNGSSDGSADFVDALHEPRFTLVRAQRNLGFAAASNLGAAQAPAAEFIALLNPDAFAEPHWLALLVAAADAQPRAAALGCHLVDARDPMLTDGTGDQYHVSGRAWRRDHGAATALASRRPAGPVFAPCAAAALYRRAAWDAAGGLDEDFFCYMEDVDLAFRLRLLGWECVHVPGAVCRHVGSAITGRRSDFSVYHGQRNLVWVFVKNMPAPLFALLLPLHLLLNLAALLLFARRGQLGVAWRAKRDAVAGLRANWRKRRQIQAHRTMAVGPIWARLDKRPWPPLKSPS
jgi:GT2 family glycosyltransferase